jgi:hypothetical protein
MLIDQNQFNRGIICLHNQFTEQTERKTDSDILLVYQCYIFGLSLLK